MHDDTNGLARRALRGMAFAFAAALTLLFVQDAALGCSLRIPEFTVAPDFSVQVTRAGRPVAGLTIELRPRMNFTLRPLQSGRTDHAGKFTVSGLAPGRYALEVGTNSPFTQFLDVTVPTKPGAKIMSHIDLEWLREVVVVRSLVGTLRKGAHEVGEGVALRGVVMDVRDSVTAVPVLTVVTDQEGRFDLSALKPGLYGVSIQAKYVRLKGRSSSYRVTPSGSFPVEIGSRTGAISGPVDLFVSQTPCFLTYEIKEQGAQTR